MVLLQMTVSNPGTGYQSGDVVSIVNGATTQTGRDAVITVTASGDIDTLYLTNVQGTIPTGDLKYVGSGNTVVTTTSDVLTSTDDSGIFSGNYLQVQHFNHGMYANNNKLKLVDVSSDSAPAILNSELLSTSGASKK